MISQKGISKSLPEASVDFNKLREEGIAMLQALAGNQWTDYNVHDPGVTTLEALCYALTDLAYRTDLIRDALQSEDLATSDSIDQYFFKRAEISSGLPVTKRDFEKFIEKNHEAVQLAWFEEFPLYGGGNAVKGAYEIAILLKYDSRYHNLNTDVVRVPFNDADTMLEVIFFDQQNKRMVWKNINKIVGCKWDQSDKDNFFVFEKHNCQISLILDVINENRTQTDFIETKGRVTLIQGAKGKKKSSLVELNQDAIVEKLQSQEFLDALVSGLEKEQHKENILARIKTTLLPCRNLCEDFIALRVVNQQDVKLDAEIILNDHAPPADVMLKQIYNHLDRFLFRLVQQSKDQPSEKKNILYGSNLIEEIVRIEGIEAARISGLNLFIDGVPTISLKDPTSFECIYLQRFAYYVPRISRQKSNIAFARSAITEKVSDAFEERSLDTPLYSAESAIVHEMTVEEKDVPITNPVFLQSLESYDSVQRDFPEIYRLDEDLSKIDGDPAMIGRTVQFKTYLLFFERLMIDYLQKLYGFKDLLSVRQNSVEIETEIDRLKRLLPELNHLKIINEDNWSDMISSESDKHEEVSKKHKILDHLLARFASAYQPVVRPLDDVEALNRDLDAKKMMLRDMPVITRERGLGLSLDSKTIWNGELLSGFQKRMYRLLGLKGDQFHHIQLSKAKGKDPLGFYLVEHILLVKKEEQTLSYKKFNNSASILYEYITNMSDEYKDNPAYTFQVSIVFPNWYPDWTNQKNRIEKMVQAELPAHILPYFHWLNKKNLAEFESCFEDWLASLLKLNI